MITLFDVLQNNMSFFPLKDLELQLEPLRMIFIVMRMENEEDGKKLEEERRP